MQRHQIFICLSRFKSPAPLILQYTCQLSTRASTHPQFQSSGEDIASDLGKLGWFTQQPIQICSKTSQTGPRNHVDVVRLSRDWKSLDPGALASGYKQKAEAHKRYGRYSEEGKRRSVTHEHVKNDQEIFQQKEYPTPQQETQLAPTGRDPEGCASALGESQENPFRKANQSRRKEQVEREMEARASGGTMASGLEQVFTKDAGAPAAPYSQAIKAAGQVWVSGQIPQDSNGNLIHGSIAERTAACCRNIKLILGEAGSHMSKVVRVGVFLTDMKNFAEMNAEYEKWFPHKPARSCVAVYQLPKGVEVEIEAVALQ